MISFLLRVKGMKTTRSSGPTKMHFDDREISRPRPAGLLSIENLSRKGTNVHHRRNCPCNGWVSRVGSGNASVSGVSTDSRSVAAGELFVALKGDRFDGHDYIAAAVEKGINSFFR